MQTDRVVVVGAGIGGLSAAIELARCGADVTVVERAAAPGGKMRTVKIGDAAIDAGPTVFTMRWVFEEIFAAAGSTLDRHLTMTPLHVLARHAWHSTDRLDLHASIQQSAAAIGDFAGAAEARGFLAFSAEARRMYEVLRAPFLESDKPTPVSLTGRIGLDRMGDLLAIRPFDTLWDALGGHFRDPRLRQLFGRYATYCGSSPFLAPATLMLIAHVEQEGVWTIAGGMGKLADALRTLAESLGARFRFGTHVRRIDTAHGCVSGVTLDTGERIAADAVIANADPGTIAGGAFGPDVATACAAPSRKERSLSAVTWALTAEVRGPALTRHNVFFSDDYAAEFQDLLARRRLPTDPTVYLCAQDRDDTGTTPGDGHDRLLLLINAPADGDTRTLTPKERDACETRVFDRLHRCGLTISKRSADQVVTTPDKFNVLFPATGGALYGRATHGWAGAFQRPGAQTKTAGLYLAGGGVHPGAGVPMAALSGRTAARLLLADRASTRTSRRAATSGGMSTP